MILHCCVKGRNAKEKKEWLESVQKHLTEEEITPSQTKRRLGVKDHLAQCDILCIILTQKMQDASSRLLLHHHAKQLKISPQ